ADLGLVFLFRAEDGIRDAVVTGVQTCALPSSGRRPFPRSRHRHRSLSCGFRASLVRRQMAAYPGKDAGPVMELADMQVLEACAARRAGSSPARANRAAFPIGSAARPERKKRATRRWPAVSFIAGTTSTPRASAAASRSQ